jgi:hypothetical protein
MVSNSLVKSAVIVRVADLKRKIRALKQRYMLKNRLAAMPKIRLITINSNYTNPVTLGPPPVGVVVYKIKDPVTGRNDYYNKQTFWRLVKGAVKNNSQLLTDRKKNLFPNPVTRQIIQAKNVERVVVRAKPKTPTRSAAARKIASVLRKKAAVKKRKTPSQAKKNNTRKSH